MIKETHRKYFQIAGISIEVNSDIPFKNNTFASKFDPFEIFEPFEENIVLNHHFYSDGQQPEPDLSNKLYFRPPWAIYQQGERWIYQWIKIKSPYENYFRTVVTDQKHSYLEIYNDDTLQQKFLEGGLTSLTLFPTDQILIGRFLAYRNGCIMHSVGIILDGKGYLFVGHSAAGKSTLADMMKKNGALILCDDRNIIRKKNGCYTVSGSWSNGDIPDVSPETAPLAAIFFLIQSDEDRLELIKDENLNFERLLACLIRPLETRDWWEKSLDFLTLISQQIPCWDLRFKKNGNVFDLIKGLP